MLRFTIRELLILTVTTGLAVGWWMDHRQHLEVAEDARMLARYFAHGISCGIESGVRNELEEKYGAHRRMERIEIRAEDEAKLGINIEQ